MGPRKRTIWAPLVRLFTFVVAVVLAGQFTLTHLLGPCVDKDVETRHRSLDRTIENLERGASVILHPVPVLEVPEPAPDPPARPVEKKKDEPVSGARGEDKLIAAYVAPAPPADLLAYLDRKVDATFLPTLDGNTEPSYWDLPRTLPLEPLPEGIRSDWFGDPEISGVEHVANALFGLPEKFVDGVVAGVRLFSPSDHGYVVRLQDEEAGSSLTSRLLDIEQTRPSLRRPFVTFFGRLLHEEAQFFAKFDSSVLNTHAFEYGAEDIDMEELEREQTKVLWDALKSTYLSKYRVRGETTIKSHDIYFRQWRGEDFVVMPVLLAGWTYYRGIEKRISFGDLRMTVYSEPVRRLASAIEDERTQEGLIGLGVRAPFLPFQLIVSAGVYDGHTKIDFVGIGTDFRQIRRLLSLEDDDERRP